MIHGQWLSSSVLAEIEAGGTDAHRVFASAYSWVDRFGPVYLISSSEPEEAERHFHDLTAWAESVGRPVGTVMGRRLVKQAGEEDKPFLLSGEALTCPKLVVNELGQRYEVDFAAGYSTGLFADQRGNRAWVRARRPSRVLNCFAYTCSFSVVAAANGATTTNLDLSGKYLEWGKRNFALNQLDPSAHRFWKADVMERWPGLVRKGEQFDLIILDPPTFSRGAKGRVFRVGDQFPVLLDLALASIASGGAILLSTNHSELSCHELEEMALEALDRSGRTGQFHRVDPPDDFAGGPAASTSWLLPN